MLQGKLINLKPMILDDVNREIEWFDKGELMKTYIGTPLFSSEEIRTYLEACIKDSTNNKYFSIFNKENVPIGSCSLEHIDWIHRNAEYGVSFGKQGNRYKEYAWEALMKSVEYAFEVLNLHRIEAKIYVANKPMLKATKEWIEMTRDVSGVNLFVHEGTLRDAVFVFGKYSDYEVFSVLQTDYVKAKNKVNKLISQLKPGA